MIEFFIVIPASFKKRLQTLELKADSAGKNSIKAFIYHAEAPTPFWQPEHPVVWIKANPKGTPVLLQMRNCGELNNRR